MIGIRRLLVVLTGFWAVSAFAQAYPDRPVRVIVPIAAGGGTDLIARVVSTELGKIWGQPVVVDNRPGAGGVIGTELAARAPKDGYTLLVGNVGSIAISPSLYKQAHYDTLRDFAPISLIATAPLTLVVNPSIEGSLPDILKAMKADPKHYNFGSSGVGQSTHLAAELFKLHTGTESVAVVPYKGAAPAVTDLLANHVQLLFDATQALAYVKDGKLRAIAVTSPKRSPLYPNVPTMAEAGVPGFEVTTWFGMLAPKGTPPAIVEKINQDLARVIASDSVRKRIVDVAMSEAVSDTSAEFASFIASETDKWRDVIVKQGLTSGGD
jgi:tripartite-type tricarboxylate transporter receptor subunit TctC